MGSNNEYMRKYILNRYHQRKIEARDLLGNECKKCGFKGKLEFDHIDRKTKGFTIAKLWSVNEERFWVEVKKCQLLCKRCHNVKTQKELGKKVAIGTHGTLSSYRYCKCDLCKEAKSKWQKIYMKNRRANSSAVVQQTPFKR